MEETLASMANIPVWLTPNICNDEIDVSWVNAGNPHAISVDRIVNAPLPTHVVIRQSPPITFWPDFGAVNTNTWYTYNVFNWDQQNRMTGSGTSSIFISSCFTQFSTAFIQGNRGIRDLLVPREDVINQYTHTGDVIDPELWSHIIRLKTSNDGARTQALSASLIQNRSSKLEVVARIASLDKGSNYLVGYQFDSISGWQGPVDLVADNGPIDHVTGPSALITSDFDNQGKFELLVPRGAVIDHYTHETETVLGGPWKHIHTLTPPNIDQGVQVTAITLIFTPPGAPPIGNLFKPAMLQAIARISPPSGQGSDYLTGYQFDSISGWQGPVKLAANDGPIDQVTGSSALVPYRPLIMSPGGDSQIEFELLVPRGAVIDHYQTKGTVLEGRWEHVHTLMPPNDDTQIQFKSAWLLESTSGNIEAIARISSLSGKENDYLVGYALNPASGWQGPVRLVANDGPILAGGVTPV